MWLYRYDAISMIAGGGSANVEYWHNSGVLGDWQKATPKTKDAIGGASLLTFAYDDDTDATFEKRLFGFRVQALAGALLARTI